MSDTSPWASPSGEHPVAPAAPVTPPPPGFAGPPPGYSAPPPGYPAPPPGWTPPPRPGLIPLAPLGLGAILGGAFRVLRRNPRPVVGFSLVLHLVLAVINIAVTALFTTAALSQYFDALNTISTTGEVSPSSLESAGSSLLVATLTGFIAALFSFAGDTILQGVITTEVARGTVGEKLPLSALWRRTRGRIGALFGWAGLVIAATALALGVLGGIVALLFALGGGGVVAGILVAILFFFGAVVLGIWLTTKLSLVPSALVIERLGLRGAIARSWSLTRGFFWRTFGIELLVAVIIAVAAYIVEIPVSIAIELVTALNHPTGLGTSTATLSSVFGVSAIAGAIVAALIATVTAVISTAATSLIYIDLRIRKEGLDLTLMRFVEARAAGQTDIPDPYLTAESRHGEPAQPAGSTE